MRAHERLGINKKRLFQANANPKHSMGLPGRTAEKQPDPSGTTPGRFSAVLWQSHGVSGNYFGLEALFALQCF